jgi:hypothetical protein
MGITVDDISFNMRAALGKGVQRRPQAAIRAWPEGTVRDSDRWECPVVKGAGDAERTAEVL